VTKQKRKTANAKPLTGNPLFPAVVALWFGALFGLGSLAVRPSLLEGLVLKSHIDLIVPAAAPPLGITARILLALILAAFGATLGIMLSRRLTRPKVEVHERKRGARDLAANSPRVRSRDAHPDAPARRPISAHEELGGEHALEQDRAPSGPGMLANRRRALAIIHDEPQYVPKDLAPLPGENVIQPLDLAALALPADPLPQAAVVAPELAAPAASALDWSNASPVAIPTMSEPVRAELAPLDGRQVFGMAPPEIQPDPPRQIFGIVAEGDHVPQEFVQAAGFQTSGFNTADPSPPFDRVAEASAAVFAERSESLPQFTSEPIAPPVAVMPEPTPAAAAAPAQQLASPASLGMTDLAARLGESMRRRRALAQTPAVAVQTEAAVEPIAPQEIPEAALPAMPSAFAPLAPAQPVPVPSAFETPAPIVPDEAAPNPFAESPVAEEPVAAPAFARFAAAAPVQDQPDFTAPLTMPAAMRPLALDAFLEDDAPFDDASLLPPRNIAAPMPVIQRADFAAPVADPAPVAVYEPEAIEGESPVDDGVDNPYASLLGVAPVRQAFVRIDEPVGETYEAIEPVVIFPGQAPQIMPLAAAAPTGAEDNGFRRFDAPASAGQGQPVAANTAASLVDPAEAAQALRAALSNLQRMSGAA
jgi:hypothetical protein